MTPARPRPIPARTARRPSCTATSTTATSLIRGIRGGGAKETRTLDLRNASAALCQLSYRPGRNYRTGGSAPAFSRPRSISCNVCEPAATHRLALYGPQARPDHATPKSQNSATARVLASARPAGRAEPLHRDPALAGSQPVWRAGPGRPELFAAADPGRERERGGHHDPGPERRGRPEVVIYQQRRHEHPIQRDGAGQRRADRSDLLPPVEE